MLSGYLELTLVYGRCKYLYFQNLGPLHTRDWEPATITLRALSLVKKVEPIQVRFTHSWGTNGVCECKMDVKVYIDSYMASNGSCFMVTWALFKNHPLEVGMTQNQETMALRTLTTIGLFYFIRCEEPHEYKLIEIAFGWGLSHI